MDYVIVCKSTLHSVCIIELVVGFSILFSFFVFRLWFHSNKQEYSIAREDFVSIVNKKRTTCEEFCSFYILFFKYLYIYVCEGCKKNAKKETYSTWKKRSAGNVKLEKIWVTGIWSLRTIFVIVIVIIRAPDLKEHTAKESENYERTTYSE